MKIFIVVILIIGISVFIGWLTPTDSTDISRWNRSGLGVYTDNATGVQYVKAGMFGGITPRLNSDGSVYRVNK